MYFLPRILFSSAEALRARLYLAGIYEPFRCGANFRYSPGVLRCSPLRVGIVFFSFFPPLHTQDFIYSVMTLPPLLFSFLPPTNSPPPASLQSSEGVELMNPRVFFMVSASPFPILKLHYLSAPSIFRVSPLVADVFSVVVQLQRC